jgi:putative SOS response-associated peptidase YedK
MGFHYSLKKKKRNRKLKAPDLLAQLEFNFKPVYHVNGFSFPEMPVITNTNQNVLSSFFWGLAPSWARSWNECQRIRKMTLNAKAETIFEKPSFKNPILKRRCLVPATGFFEWHHQGDKTYPYYISLKDEDVFMFAGIWDSWKDKNTGEIYNSYSIITTEANPLLEKIHNTKKRMPVILDPEKEFLWLDENLKPSYIMDLLKPYDEKEMQAHTINREKILSKNEAYNEEVLEQIVYEEIDMIIQINQKEG